MLIDSFLMNNFQGSHDCPFDLGDCLNWKDELPTSTHFILDYLLYKILIACDTLVVASLEVGLKVQILIGVKQWY